jgi:hypothetical protein
MDAVARDHRVFFFDAPVSGGQAGVENGVLTVMVGGDADAFERTRTLMAAYGRSVVHMGPSGAGHLQPDEAADTLTSGRIGRRGIVRVRKTPPLVALLQSKEIMLQGRNKLLG